MPPKSIQAPETPLNGEHQPRYRARKRRKRNHEQESIYLADEPEPYGPSIQPSQVSSRTDSEVASGGNGEAANAIEIEAGPSESQGTKRKRKDKDNNGKDRDESYRLRALKAWETKRNRQRERFEALEASSSLMGLGWGSGIPMDLSTGTQRSERGISSSAVDPLLELTNLGDLPEDLPKDDLLQSLQSYSSRYYTANNLLLKPHRRIRQKPANQPDSASQLATASGEMTASPVHPHLAIPEEDSGSEYGTRNATNEKDNDSDEVEEGDDQEEGFIRTIESTTGPGPRKRGGQRGKRKLRDMYLALDGSALLALGILIQEQIISRLRQEGYVPASALDGENEEDIYEDTELDEGAFAVSDDGSDGDEDEEGSDYDQDDEA